MTAELSPLEKHVLIALGKLGAEATPEAILDKSGLDELVQVMNASSWLQAKGLVRHEETLRTFVTLGKGGKADVLRGLPERRAIDAVLEAGGVTTMDALVGSGAIDDAEKSVAIGWMKRKGLVTISKAADGATVLTATDAGRAAKDTPMADEVLLDLLRSGEQEWESVDPEGLRLLTTRQDLVKKREEITRLIHLTKKGKMAIDKGIEIKDSVAQLTPELVASGRWKDADIRPYDVTAFAPVATAGKKHPLRQIIDRIRLAFLEMGFTEIEGPYVRSAFWNMDALYIPQDHPAREMQDTFYLSEPATANLAPDTETREFVKAVQHVHEDGGDTGSTGWRNPEWRLDIAQKNLLRTHTTPDTVNYLRDHPDKSVKVFSVDRVFRNEALDSTHLPEFHQVEGIVMEEGANFRQLVGLLKEFYAKMGFDQIRVRPAYFPYTEPSLELEVFYNNKWMELGGAGIFRPEVTKPLGVQHPVLAWGLGLERLAMMTLGLKDLRELYVSDIEWLRNAPLVE